MHKKIKNNFFRRVCDNEIIPQLCLVCEQAIAGKFA